MPRGGQGSTSMELHVFLAVLAAALCHAAWNAGLKLDIDPVLAITLTAVSAGVVAMPLLPVVGLPSWDAWPYLAASLALHLVYWTALAEAYRTGDLGQVYPIARGTAPLATTAASAAILSEVPGPRGVAGVVLLTAGVVLLSLKGGRPLASIDRRAVGFALLTAVTISAYTIVDGQGARIAGNPHGYAVLFFALNGVMMLAYGAARHGRVLLAPAGKNAAAVLAGGALSVASYWIALWAMTKAPIPLVAATRESSVLFAAAIGIFVLREPVIGARIAAALLVVAGLVLVRLA